LCFEVDTGKSTENEKQQDDASQQPAQETNAGVAEIIDVNEAEDEETEVGYHQTNEASSGLVENEDAADEVTGHVAEGQEVNYGEEENKLAVDPKDLESTDGPCDANEVETDIANEDEAVTNEQEEEEEEDAHEKDEGDNEPGNEEKSVGDELIDVVQEDQGKESTAEVDESESKRDDDDDDDVNEEQEDSAQPHADIQYEDGHV
jgi:hypothetical protein